MAKKKDLDKLDTFSFNDINFDDFGDFGFDAPELNNDRKPVQRIAGRFRRGMTDRFGSRYFQEELLRRALPREYSPGIDAYHELNYAFRTLNDGIKRELKPGMRELRDLSRRIFPGKPPLIPEKMYEKFNRWVDEEEYRRQSDSQRDNDLTSIMLGEVFSRQNDIHEAERQEDSVREELKSITSKKRFEFSHLERVRTNTLLTSLVNYQDRVTTSYSRRMLELNLKQYLTQVRILEATKVTGEKTNKELEAITKNTGLPDFVKMRSAESIKEMTRQRVIQSIFDSSPVSKIAGLSKRLVGNFTKNTLANFKNIGTMLSTGAGGYNQQLDMAAMDGEDGREPPKGFREIFNRGLEAGAEHVLPTILSYYAGKGADRFRGTTERLDDRENFTAPRWLPGRMRSIIESRRLKNISDSARHRIVRGGELADYWVGGADQHLQNEIAHGERRGLFGALLSMSDADKEAFRANRSISTMLYGKDRFGVPGGSTDSAIATEEVIPNWLQRIWGEIHMLRTNTDSVEGEIYDRKHRKFVRQTDASAGALKHLQVGYNKSYIDTLTEKIIKEFTGDHNLSVEAKRAMASQIKSDAMMGITPTPERYRWLSGVEPSAQKEIREAIEKTFDYDPIEDKLKTTQDGFVGRRRRVLRTSRALMGELGDVKSRVVQLTEEGKLETLRAMGLVDETPSGLAINYNRYLQLMDQGYSPTDLGLPPDGVGPNTKIKGPSGGGSSARPVVSSKTSNDQSTGQTKTIKDLFTPGEEYPRIQAFKLRAGGYIDQKTGKVIRSIEDIKGTVVTASGDVVITASEINAGLLDKYGNRVSLSISMLKDTGRRLLETTRNKIRETKFTEITDKVKEQFKDLYVPGEVKPRLTKARLLAGDYIDKSTGTVLTSFSDIRGDIEDKSGNMIISAEEMGRGLIDKYGDKVTDIKVWGQETRKKSSARFSAFETNIRNRLSSLTQRRDNLDKKIDYIPSPSDTLLKNIYNLLNFRMPGLPDSHLNAMRTGDLDGDGIRDGSWQDRIRKRKQKEEEKREEQSRNKELEMMTGTQAGGNRGLLAGLLGMLGLGGLAGGEGGGGVNIWGLPGIGGGPSTTTGKPPVMGPPRPQSRLGRIGNAARATGRFALNAALNPVGLLLGLGARGIGGLARHTGRATMATAKTAGRLAMGTGRLALGMSRLALPFMMSPVGLAITGGVLAGYAGWKMYQSIKARREFNNNILHHLRMAQYGVNPKNPELATKVLMLEEMREKDFVRPGEQRPYDDPKTQDEQMRIMFTFDADPGDTMHQVRVADWYNNRGGPVMSTWSNALYLLKGSKSLDDIDSLNPTEQLELLKMVRIPSDDPYSAINFPMIPIGGQEIEAYRAADVDTIYEQARKTLEKNADSHSKALLKQTEDTPLRSSRSNAGRTEALAERAERNRRLRQNIIIDMGGAGVLKAPDSPPEEYQPTDYLNLINSSFNDVMTGNVNPRWVWPMKSGRISSEFGYRNHPDGSGKKPHKGIDIAAPEGTPVFAAAEGTVRIADYLRGYGNAIYITHLDGKETRYAHLSAFAPGIAPGVKVRAGQLIGFVGNTGVSFGPHLHFEIREGMDNTSGAINPLTYINDRFLTQQLQVLNKTKQEAGSVPQGYAEEDSPELEGMDTIASTAAPNANKPYPKDVPFLLSRDYKAELEAPVPTNTGPGQSPSNVFNQDKAQTAYNSDMLDASKAQITSINSVSQGISGMTHEQREANESLRRIAAQLEKQQTTQQPLFRRANEGNVNPTMTNQQQQEVLGQMYQLAVKNQLDPSQYMTREQLSTVEATYVASTPASLTRTSASMPY